MNARSAERAAALRPAADPNVIPFIDVLLVLLVIFMVTAPKPTVDLQINLPANGMLTPAPDKATIVDVLNAPGGPQFLIEGESVGADALVERALAHARANNPASDLSDVRARARILVRADQDTAYANVVFAIDELQHARFGAVGIFAQDAETP